MKPFVVFCQPLYGYIPPIADGHQKCWLTYNLSCGLIHWTLTEAMSYIDRARNTLVTRTIHAPEMQPTHIAWGDQDMMFPKNLVRELLKADKDVVSGVYFGKDEDHTLVAYDDVDRGTSLMDFDPTGLQRVGGVGFGCCLTRVDVFRRMEQHFGDRAWFKCQDGKGWGGEDLHFARRCKEMGIPIWMDGRLQCIHVGEDMIDKEHWEAAKRRKAS